MLNILPSAPTDSIYKFFSIVGVWLLVTFSAMLMGMTYLEKRMEYEYQLNQQHNFATHQERQISARLSSIRAGHLAENVLDWLPPHLKNDPVAESKFLNDLLPDFRDSADKSKDVDYTKIQKLVHDIYASKFPEVMSALAFFSLLFCFYGFAQWMRNIQRPFEKMQTLELQAKEYQVRKAELDNRKIELEIKHLLRIKVAKRP